MYNTSSVGFLFKYLQLFEGMYVTGTFHLGSCAILRIRILVFKADPFVPTMLPSQIHSAHCPSKWSKLMWGKKTTHHKTQQLRN